MKLAAAACGLLLAIQSAPQLPEAWKDWKSRRAIDLSAAPAASLVGITIPREVFAGAQPNLADLRVVDEAGREVAYILHIPRAQREQQWRAVRLAEVSFLPGQFTQAIVDTGQAMQTHNSLRLRIPDTDFFAWVEVAASDDGREWRILRECLPIYRFSAEGHPGNQTLSYSESTSRYLRVRILKGDARLRVTGCEVSHEVSREPERMAYEAAFEPDPEPPARHSAWLADFGTDRLPISAVAITADEPEFHRPTQIYESDDGNQWRGVGYGEIYRLRRAQGTQEQLHVRFLETTARYLRVAVYNRNDPPLTNVRLEVYGTPRRLLFRPQAGRQYWLLFGNPKAPAPDYELARLVTANEMQAAVQASLQPDPSATLARVKPWTERHRIVLWLALLVAVVVLGFLAIRSLRHAA